jgi:hypothetical protein
MGHSPGAHHPAELDGKHGDIDEVDGSAWAAHELQDPLAQPALGGSLSWALLQAIDSSASLISNGAGSARSLPSSARAQAA